MSALPEDDDRLITYRFDGEFGLEISYSPRRMALVLTPMRLWAGVWQRYKGRELQVGEMVHRFGMVEKDVKQAIKNHSSEKGYEVTKAEWRLTQDIPGKPAQTPVRGDD